MKRDYPSLAEFAATWSAAQESGAPGWLHPTRPPALDGALGGRTLGEVLDTAVALQRSEWLVDGIYAGPTAHSRAWDAVVRSARRLDILPPITIIGPCSDAQQTVIGTNERPVLRLSAPFFERASTVEQDFVLGRLCGHVRAQQVSWATLYALMADHRGIRSVARRYIGPTLDIVLAPTSLAVRLGLSRWHRAAEINADRAGLVVCQDPRSALETMLRLALGSTPDITPEQYLAQREHLGRDHSVSRWTEALADSPWLDKRMRALDLFVKSSAWRSARLEEPKEPSSDALLDDETLAAEVNALLGVG